MLLQSLHYNDIDKDYSYRVTNIYYCLFATTKTFYTHVGIFNNYFVFGKENMR